jgi:hypothetical protein
MVTSHIVLYSWIIVGNATATDAADSSTLSITTQLFNTTLTPPHSVFGVHILGGDEESEDTASIVYIAYKSAY